ncbi:MAG: hypothetical protein AAFQ90_07905, partial [Pseudomonadota bacterium]
MKRLQLPLFLTFLFWMFYTLSREWPGHSARRKLTADVIDWLLVGPMTLPGALAFVFVVTAFITLLFWPEDEDTDTKAAVVRERWNLAWYGASGTTATVITQNPHTVGEGLDGGLTFGKRTASFNTRKIETKMINLEIEKRALRENSLDWYLSEHGFEGRWEQIARQFSAAGDTELAASLSEAG